MKILAVDNHPVMLRFMHKLLEKKGYTVKTASDGLQALEVLKSYSPDVIFVDLIMPKIDGKKLCRVIRQREHLKHPYIAILSAVAVEEGNDYKKFGADACIAKGPFDRLGKNILEVVESVEEGGGEETDGIRGKDYAYQRTITKELIYTKRHFEIILNNMSEGIMELTREGYVIFLNPAASAILNTPEEKILGSLFFNLFLKPEKEQIEQLFNETLETSKSHFSQNPVETHNKKLLMNFLPVTENEEGGLLIILEDITDKMKIEAQLKHAMKMEAIGTLSGGIAHDFNNLLMGIQGNLSLMLLDVHPNHPHHECLKNIEKIVRSGSELTEKLLGYARKGKYETRLFNLNNLVVESSDIFERTKREISIERELSGELWPIEGDRVQLEQVLLNLYVNSWQAMPDGGTIRIETKNITHKEINSDLYKPRRGKYVMLKVSDNGVGIDKQSLDRIFDPFFTTKELGRGTGLGLASVYGIVKNHSGYIEVKSEKGKGAEFFIYIPASSKKLVEDDSRHAVAPENETILLVDDEEMVLEAGQRMLRMLGYDVITAKNGREAVETFRKKPDLIRMVVLDLIMPEMGGAETYDKLKEIRKDVKILISSGYGMNGLPETVDLKGGDGFIQKPYDLKHLFEKTREILG